MTARTILVPTDFSSHADRALEMAIDLAGETGGEIHLLHAYDLSTISGLGETAIVQQSVFDRLREAADVELNSLADKVKEKALGRIEVRDTFHVSRIGTIAGCYVLDGKVVRGCRVRLVRDSVVIWEGKMSSLKRFKDDVKEVMSGYECGIGLENYNDIKVGDIIEAYELEEVKTTLV